MSEKKYVCKYCGAKLQHGGLCALCYKKLALIRKLQAMIRAKKEEEDEKRWTIHP